MKPAVERMQIAQHHICITSCQNKPTGWPFSKSEICGQFFRFKKTLEDRHAHEPVSSSFPRRLLSCLTLSVRVASSAFGCPSPHRPAAPIWCALPPNLTSSSRSSRAGVIRSGKHSDHAVTHNILIFFGPAGVPRDAATDGEREAIRPRPARHRLRARHCRPATARRVFTVRRRWTVRAP
jgi:hypothetical protein